MFETKQIHLHEKMLIAYCNKCQTLTRYILTFKRFNSNLHNKQNVQFYF